MKQVYFKNLMVEPTNICNLTCPVCPTGSGEDKRRKGFMKLRQFKKILTSNKNNLDFLQISGYGEPFLSPYIRDMINFAGHSGIYSGIFTNGLVINDRVANVFKNNYRFKITFSIDSIKSGNYSYYREGGNLEKALRNLVHLINFKKKYSLTNLEIIWQFLIMKTNEGEIEKAEKMARKLGVDEFKLKTISIYEDHPRYADFTPKRKKYKRKKGIIKKCIFINPGTPFILRNGDVVPFCVFYKKEHVLGNIFRENLLKIWNKKRYEKFRDDHKRGVNLLCNNECRYGRK